MVKFSDDPRLQEILFRRFELDGKPPDISKDIALRYDLNRERIRQLEKKALRHCRHPSTLRFWVFSLPDLVQAILKEKEDAAT